MKTNSVRPFPAYYGVLFPGKEEAAFSNFRFFEAIGSVCMYILNPMLCTGTVLMILFALMIVGMIGYGRPHRKCIFKTDIAIQFQLRSC